MTEPVDPPPCAWCGQEATGQVYVGTEPARQGRGPRRYYSWLCDECSRTHHTEKEWSRRG